MWAALMARRVSTAPDQGYFADPGLGRRIINPVDPAVVCRDPLATDVVGFLHPVGSFDLFEGDSRHSEGPFCVLAVNAAEGGRRLPRRSPA